MSKRDQLLQNRRIAVIVWHNAEKAAGDKQKKDLLIHPAAFCFAPLPALCILSFVPR